MSGRIHQLLPAVLMGFFGVATAWAEAGYLPQTGPLSLRFRVPPAPVTQHATPPMAPPLPAPIVLPSPPMPSAPMEASNSMPAKMSQPMTVTNAPGPALEYDARESMAGPMPANTPDAVISPQMLIRYFTAPSRAGTNTTGAGAATPFGFTPPSLAAPAPPPPPASKPATPTSP